MQLIRTAPIDTMSTPCEIEANYSETFV